MAGERKIIGSAWLKSNDKGEYIALSFNAEEIKNIDLSQCWVNMSVNQKKAKPTHPDYIISASPKQQMQQRQAPKPEPKAAFPKPRNFAPSQQSSDDDDNFRF